MARSKSLGEVMLSSSRISKTEEDDRQSIPMADSSNEEDDVTDPTLQAVKSILAQDQLNSLNLGETVSTFTLPNLENENMDTPTNHWKGDIRIDLPMPPVRNLNGAKKLLQRRHDKEMREAEAMKQPAVSPLTHRPPTPFALPTDFQYEDISSDELDFEDESKTSTPKKRNFGDGKRCIYFGCTIPAFYTSRQLGKHHQRCRTKALALNKPVEDILVCQKSSLHHYSVQDKEEHEKLCKVKRRLDFEKEKPVKMIKKKKYCHGLVQVKPTCIVTYLRYKYQMSDDDMMITFDPDTNMPLEWSQFKFWVPPEIAHCPLRMDPNNGVV